MKFTLKWLKEYLDTDVSLQEICDKLPAIGLEVEDVIDNAETLKGFNCVLVKDCQKHPESDHLNICKVVTATGDILQIICGASNVKSGVKAILCPIDSTPPGLGIKITKSKIKGYESQGMLCSEKELGLGEDHKGILLLPDETLLGKNIAEIKNLNDVFVDISITPNRGDCLGVYGIARDLAATGLGTLKPFENCKINESVKNPFNITIDDENCPEFAIRYIKGVKNCESPAWLKQRLEAIGFTPKTALVDITNYVMWCLNRPLHCYDADKIKGDFLIKKSKGGEKYLALDKYEYILPENATLIANTNDDILGLAGIIGGGGTATELTTTNIVLECAIFEPISIATTARKIGINTDAKYRFERSVDGANREVVMNYATKLILDICGGEASDVAFKKHKSFDEIFKKRIIDFKITDFKRVLGIEIPTNNIEQILIKLGYDVKIIGSNISVITPSWRNGYIEIPENVIEDVIRIYGYEKVQPALVSEEKIDEDDINKINRNKSDIYYEVNKLLAGNGLTEIISWSFINEKLSAEFAPINDDLRLLNPMTQDMAYLRPSLIPGMLNVIEYNNARSIDNVSVFENGVVFLGTEVGDQKKVLAGVRSGLTTNKNIYGTSRAYDVFDVKKDLYDVLEVFGINADSLTLTQDFPDYFHPSKSGAIKMGSIILGVFGEINPFKMVKFDLKYKVNAFEIYLDNVPRNKAKATQKKKFTLNELQPIYRDFAFIVDKTLEVGKIIDVVKKINKDLIKEINLFDIYNGKGMKEGKKSIAFTIKIQPTGNSLTLEEIDDISSKIIGEIVEKFNGVLRDK
ncbi:MAG: phenylalanine--tRNA ligase subunit beta [Rickettsiales bacterium]|jgi:phenylalanyl-tRNA synthetase beta chain|nr:phenylalanine--tRNA ligase subunit beta [Rickettsiales bacterium]